MLATYPLFRGHARIDWKLASQWERKLAAMRKTAPDRGVFTRLDHEIHLDLEAYLLDLGLDSDHLRLYLVPARETAKALTELRLMSVTFATLFPDLQGAALQADFETAQFALTVLAQLGLDD